MLEHLKLKNLGPATELNFQFGSRINVLTGDNGLGDLAWWVLTRTWADNRVIHPAPSHKDEASISYHVYGKGGPNAQIEERRNRS